MNPRNEYVEGAERVPNGRYSKGKRSATHFCSDIRHNEEILVGGSKDLNIEKIQLNVQWIPK